MMKPSEVLEEVKRMRNFLSVNRNLESVLKEFGDFKKDCPSLFEIVLENKQDYMKELESMVSYANEVDSMKMSYSDATKVVKFKYDNEFIYPLIVNKNITSEQKLDSEEYIRNQKEEVERILNKKQQP